MSKRLFVAIGLSKKAGDAVYRRRAEIERHCTVPLRWVPAHHLHVTLMFIGDTAEEGLPGIVEACRRSVKMAPFTMTTSSFGCFPSAQRARIFWLGLDGGDEIQSLYRSLVANLQHPAGPTMPLPYHPHITLARTKRIGRVPVGTINKEVSIRESVAVDNITLFESILGREGAEYVAVEVFKLGCCSTGGNR